MLPLRTSFMCRPNSSSWTWESLLNVKCSSFFSNSSNRVGHRTRRLPRLEFNSQPATHYSLMTASKMLLGTSSEKLLPSLIESQPDTSNLAVVHSQSRWPNNNSPDNSTTNPYVVDMKHCDNQLYPPSPSSHGSGPNNCAYVPLSLFFI